MKKQITKMMLACAVLIGGVAIGRAEPQEQQPVEPLDNYNVVWNSPSENAQGSMPLGNGDVGINAWVEANGDLVFYVSKTDAWDENARLCKIGRIRVKFDPPLMTKDRFRQELKLRDGVIEIKAEGGKLKPESAISQNPDSSFKSQFSSLIRIWVDSDQPVVRVEAESAAPVSCRAEVELWRLGERSLDKADEYGYGGGNNPKAQAYKLAMLSDVVVTSSVPQVVWYHRNTRSLYPVCLEVQHLETLKDKFVDPLLNHTFGASLRGVDMISADANALKSSKPAKRHQLSICVLAERTETVDGWLKNLDRIERAALRFSFDKARQHTAVWWQKFWNRSWVFVEEAAGSTNSNVVVENGVTNTAASVVTRGYVLQRFMNAGSGRGGSPIKFNGSIFTVEKNIGASAQTGDGDPDYRCWGGSYWFQNTRLSYGLC